MDQLLNPAVLALPFYLATLVAEGWVLPRQIAAGRPVRGYERRDTWASLGVGAVSLLTVGILDLFVVGAADWLWRFRIVDLGTTWVGWLVALVAWDLAYYWMHRSEHEVRLLWAVHVNHHSSERYNLSTALRQPWLPFVMLLFLPPIVLLGVRPWMMMVAGGINLVYQYWIHTEAIDRLPRWAELVLNTPSHHRVHHGSNPQYLDKNHGGILIVWDRLFGTFEPEVEPVTYGLTKDIHTFNLWRIFDHELVALAHDVRAATRWRDRLGFVLHGPGWQPALRPSLPASGRS